MADPRITRRSLLAGTVGIAAALAFPTCSSGVTTMKHGPSFKDPSVVYFGGRYLKYSSAPPRVAGGPWRQTVAGSPDGFTWTYLCDIEPVGELEAKGICAGGAIVLGGRVHAFWQTYGNGAKDAICHATSDDGVTFIRNPGNPIICPTGAWNCGRAIDACPVVIGDQLFVYWATRDPGFTEQMIGAHSTPLAGAASGFVGATWYQRNGGPVLRAKYPWEKRFVEAPSVIVRNGIPVMFYAGACNNAPQQIGVAVNLSGDGKVWTRLSDQPFLRNGAAGTWNSAESGHPGIFCDPRDKATWLYYQGNNGAKSATGERLWVQSRRRVTWSGHTPILGGST